MVRPALINEFGPDYAAVRNLTLSPVPQSLDAFVAERFDEMLKQIPGPSISDYSSVEPLAKPSWGTRMRGALEMVGGASEAYLGSKIPYVGPAFAAHGGDHIGVGWYKAWNGYDIEPIIHGWTRKGLEGLGLTPDFSRKGAGAIDFIWSLLSLAGIPPAALAVDGPIMGGSLTPYLNEPIIGGSLSPYVSGPFEGPGLSLPLETALDLTPAKFGPFFHKAMDNETIDLILESGKLRGTPPRNMYGGGGLPAAKAFKGEILEDVYGVEFYTNATPDKYAPSFLSRIPQQWWTGPNRFEDYFEIDVFVTKVQRLPK